MTTYLELPLEVDYTYNPPSRGLRGDYGEPLEPDEDASIEINEVCCYGRDIMCQLSSKQLAYIEEDIWQDIEDSAY